MTSQAVPVEMLSGPFPVNISEGDTIELFLVEYTESEDSKTNIYGAKDLLVGEIALQFQVSDIREFAIDILIINLFGLPYHKIDTDPNNKIGNTYEFRNSMIGDPLIHLNFTIINQVHDDFSASMRQQERSSRDNGLTIFSYDSEVRETDNSIMLTEESEIIYQNGSTDSTKTIAINDKSTGKLIYWQQKRESYNPHIDLNNIYEIITAAQDYDFQEFANTKLTKISSIVIFSSFLGITILLLVRKDNDNYLR